MSAVIIPFNKKTITLLDKISELYREEANPFIQSALDILHNYVYERNLSSVDIPYPVLLRASQDLYKVSENFLTFSDARALVRVAALNIRMGVM